jgi:hypothetical protein
MELAENLNAKSGGIRLIAVAYFFGTVISIWLLSAIGVPLPTVPGDASRDQIVILGLVGAFSLALALFPLARGVGGSAPQRLLTISAFTYVAFAVINQLQAAVFTTIGGTTPLLFFYAIPCVLAAGAAVWLVRPIEGSVTRHTAVWDRSMKTWWWRPTLVFLTLPVIEAVTGLVAQPVLEEAIRLEPSGLLIPNAGAVIGTMFLKSALLTAVTVPIAFSWRRSGLRLMFALGAAVFILSGLVGLIQATWWTISMRVAFSLQILATSVVYAAVAALLLVPRADTGHAEPALGNQ